MMNSRIASAVRLILAISSGAMAPQLALAQASGGASVVQGADAQQPATSEGVDEIVVVGRQRSAAEEVAQERIELPVVADLVGAEQISRVGDSSVSLAIRRLPGVTLVNDQFIYVRGLGERYSSTTLNGANVPSPDLTRNVIPLDLFPASIIESLAIVKGYSADMPAAFGGGNVDIRTLSIPQSPVLSFEIGSGWNSDSSNDTLTYSGGGKDWLGSDDGTRAISSSIIGAVQTYQGELDANSILDGLRRTGGQYTLADAQSVNRQLATGLNRSLDPKTRSAVPDLSVEAAAGNKWNFGPSGDWQFGALALLDYGNQWRNKERTTRSVSDPDTVHATTQQTTHQVALTGSLNMGLSYLEEHQVEFSSMYLRNTDDETAIALGNSANFLGADGRQFRNYRVRFEERALELYQLRGEHTLGPDTLGLLGNWAPLAYLQDTTFTWYFSDATATTDMPSEVLFSAEDAINFQTGQVLSTSLRSSASAGEYRFTELDDKVRSYGWEVSRPFMIGNTELGLSGGWEHSEKGRGYLQTQLGIGTTSAPSGSLSGTPGQVLTDANITNPANGFALSIGGIGTESYLAAEMVDAGYGQFDLKWNDAWRLTGGGRYENFQQLSVPVDPLEFDVNVGKIPVPADQLSSLAKVEDAFYPAVAMTHMRRDFWSEEFQLRFGWSKTVARPDLREISGATYIDPFTDARVRGNSSLITSDITNYDARAEWFFGSGDNFTVSAFYKDIADPIETIEASGSDDNISLTFINADSAEVYGLEIEWLKAAPFGESLGQWGRDLFVAGNLTVSDSEIVIGDAALNVTNNTRRMTQHSPYVLNLQVGYDAPGGQHSTTLVYNVSGERIYYAGRNGAPDAFEQPFNSVDWTYSYYPTDSLTLKLRVQNLLGQDVKINQGGVDVLEQSLGTSVKLDATFKF